MFSNASTSSGLVMSRGWVIARVRSAQIPPVNIGSERFAPHGAVREALDRRAVLGRYATLAVAPKAHRLHGNAQCSGELCRASHDRNCFAENCHAQILQL